MKRAFDLTGIKQSLYSDPLRWLLLALLVFSVYQNYREGDDLTRVCELTGPHDVSVPHPLTVQQEITNICLRR
jgi:hypothetical protein